MPANYVLLEKITVGAAGAVNVTFSGIPQTGYTDLVVKASVRVVNTGGPYGFTGYFNGYGTSYTSTQLGGDGANASSQYYSFAVFLGGNIPDGDETANTFSNAEIYIPNYSSSTTYKSFSVDSVTENNATTAYQYMVANTYLANTAISSMVLGPSSGTFAANSTFYLYGVAKLNTTPVIVPPVSVIPYSVISTDVPSV
jgi:hypothetical protein